LGFLFRISCFAFRTSRPPPGSGLSLITCHLSLLCLDAPPPVFYNQQRISRLHNRPARNERQPVSPEERPFDSESLEQRVLPARAWLVTMRFEVLSELSISQRCGRDDLLQEASEAGLHLLLLRTLSGSQFVCRCDDHTADAAARDCHRHADSHGSDVYPVLRPGLPTRTMALGRAVGPMAFRSSLRRRLALRRGAAQ
jgi:hypothetical protein